MSILLRANYLLHADVLQPEPGSEVKKYKKIAFELYFDYTYYLMNTCKGRCYE